MNTLIAWVVLSRVTMGTQFPLTLYYSEEAAMEAMPNHDEYWVEEVVLTSRSYLG